MFIRSDLTQYSQSLREFLVQFRFSLAVVRKVSPRYAHTDVGAENVRGTSLASLQIREFLLRFREIRLQLTEFRIELSRKKSGFISASSTLERKTDVGLSLLQSRFFAGQRAELALGDIELVGSGSQSIVLRLLLLRELVERLSFGNRFETGGRFSAVTEYQRRGDEEERGGGD